MINILKLTKNEISKALSKRIIISLLCFTFLLIFLLGLYIQNSASGFSERQLKNWKTYMQSEIEANNSIMNDPTIGFSSQSIITEMINQNKVYQYQIDNNIPPILNKSASTLVLKANDLFLFITICVIMLSCYLITTEYSNGTMSRLVVTCAKRWKILLSKCLSIVFLSLIFVIIFILCSVLCGWALFGFDDFSVQYVYFNGQEIVHRNVLAQLSLCALYNSLSLCAISSLAIFVAILTRSNLLGISLCFGISAFGSLLCTAFPDSLILKYTLFANTDYSKYLTNSVGYGDSSPLFSLIVLLSHSIIFISAAFFIFNKRDVTY